MPKGKAALKYILGIKPILRNMSGDYSDSEDDGPIPYKSDDESEDDDLARKIARRDTIAREKEINELKLKAKSNDMQTRKNDVSKPTHNHVKSTDHS